MNTWLFDLLGFFFPAYCPVCGNPMHNKWEVICLTCEQKIPRTNYTNEIENPVAELFWGRTKVEMATSLFRYEKGSAYQSLIHHLKYSGALKIGDFLGKLLGQELRATAFTETDCIVPVPLHEKKLKQRGFNQSEIIAQGISSITGIPVMSDLIFRNADTKSQTNKTRFERWENMHHVFSLGKGVEAYSGIKMLLTDDVVTTGSTLEACAETLRQIPDASIYIATVACA